MKTIKLFITTASSKNDLISAIHTSESSFIQKGSYVCSEDDFNPISLSEIQTESKKRIYSGDEQINELGEKFMFWGSDAYLVEMNKDNFERIIKQFEEVKTESKFDTSVLA